MSDTFVAADGKEYRTCKACARNMPVLAPKCLRCGAPMPVVASAEVASESAPEPVVSRKARG